MALVKSKPRSLSFASAGTGTLAHLAGVLFERLAKVEMVHAPYRGTNQAMVDLMEGRINSQFATIPPTLQFIRTGKMRALAVTETSGRVSCQTFRPSQRAASLATNYPYGRRLWRRQPFLWRSSRD